MGFANGASSVIIGNGAALATEIGGAVPSASSIGAAGNAAGSRLVNNLTVKSLFAGVAPGNAAGPIDCSQAVSFALQITTQGVGYSVPGVTGVVRIDWYDSTFSVLIDSTEYEVLFSSGPSTVTVINDQCLSPLAVLGFEGVLIGPGGAVTTPTVDLTFITQTVSTNRLRITQVTAPFWDGTWDKSGLLMRSGAYSLAATASAGVFYVPPTSGAVIVALTGISNSTVGAQFRLRGGFGVTSFLANEIEINSAAALPDTNPQTQFTQLPCVPSRPLILNPTNIGSQAGTVHFEVYASPD